MAEIWRYPVKSMRGERLSRTVLGPDGIPGDRIGHVRRDGNVLTARARPELLGFAGGVDAAGRPTVNGWPVPSEEASRRVRAVAGAGADVVTYDGPERFDVLPLLVTSDGALAVLDIDGRRLRPNLVIGGVEGLAEREWAGRALRIGEAVIGLHSLRPRCLMVNANPDTGQRDDHLLRRIQRDYGGSFALNAWVAQTGAIAVGDPVTLADHDGRPERIGGWVVGAPYG